MSEADRFLVEAACYESNAAQLKEQAARTELAHTESYSMERNRQLDVERETIEMNHAKARDENYWAVKLGLFPYPDGDQWCVLWGDNLQHGVCAFGNTPIEAIKQFDVEIMNARAGLPNRGEHE